ncbi:MAG: helix-turn-helix domain-containing protein [Pseudomonadota bacterium]
MNTNIIPIRRATTESEAMPGARRRFALGEEIYVQEDDAREVYQVVAGAVRTTHLSRDGRRQIGAFYYPGDVFGLESGDLHRYSAEALTDCEIVALSRATLSRDDEEAARVERLVWRGAVRELERTQAHLMLLGRKTACEKVAAFLVDLAARLGEDVTELPMGRQDMADYLGLTIETVSRMITQLQGEGMVEFLGNRRFRLSNSAGLRRLAAA